jgi:Effector-associated domain 11
MAFLETTTKFVLDLLTENEELKKFPQEFISESVKWVKSWFLTPEDPKSTAKLADPNKSIEVKKDIIEDKLAELKDNALFMKELAAKMAAFEQQKTTKRSIIEGGSFKIKGNAHVGSVDASNQQQVDEENVLKNTHFEVDGDFHLGNTSHLIHNPFNRNAPENTPIQPKNLKSVLKTLLRNGKTAEVFDKLLDLTENKDADTHQTVLVLSAQFNRLNTQENKGVIGNQEATIARNGLNDSLVSVIDGLEIA